MKRTIIKLMSIVTEICLSLVILMTFSFANCSFFVSENLKKQDKKIESQADVNIYFGRSDDNTGATESSKTDKGGAIYLESGTRYYHKGGVISGHNAKYGGAVYVSSGAVFTMTGGIIKNNSASYGGAIYVEKGGVVNLEEGAIFDNTASECGIEIYIEDGAELNINDQFLIERNSNDIETMISEETVMVGHITNGKQMHYMEYGSYPQTYVGNAMNAKLEEWYQANKPTAVKDYVIRTRTWTSYLYSDGQLYARGLSYKLGGTYLNGEPAVGSDNIAWFKIEPIKWIVLNYDEVKNHTENTIKLLSYYLLTADICFSESRTMENASIWQYSYVRNWLNTHFYNSAFSLSEKDKINYSTIKNNITGDYANADSDGKGEDTQDYVYLLSYYDYSTRYFNSKPERLCSGTDFSLSNCLGVETSVDYQTATHILGSTCRYYSRSSGGTEVAGSVYAPGFMGTSYVDANSRAIRPAIQLKLDLRNRISKDTVVAGYLNMGKQMHYMEYGSYPQTYVGNSMNATLESWYQSTNPDIVNTYETRENPDYPGTGIFNSYTYTDGNIYARGLSHIYDATYTYSNGEQVKSNSAVVWFKVEPLKWYVLNYENVKTNQQEIIELLAFYINVGYLPFNDENNNNIYSDSNIRNWLNTKLYNQAFNEVEKEKVYLKTNKNNVTGVYRDGDGIETQDYVYLLSDYEYFNKYFESTDIYSRFCSPTDFALSNATRLIISYVRDDIICYTPTELRPNGGTNSYMTRSAGSSDITYCQVDYRGSYGRGQGIKDKSTNAVRFAISVKF